MCHTRRSTERSNVPKQQGSSRRIASAGPASCRRIRRDPYHAGLADVLVKAFGPPSILAEALADIDGIDSAFIHGSWAARHEGDGGERPVGDIDLLVLGTPDRDQLYVAVSAAEERLGRPVQITIRPQDWLADGSGTFHATVTDRPMVAIIGPADARKAPEGSAS